MKRLLLFLLIFVCMGGHLKSQQTLCQNAYYLCEASTVTFKEMDEVQRQTPITTCYPANDLPNATWLIWQAGKSQRLSFDLQPMQPSDDLDFALFEVDDILGICQPSGALRCMSAGMTYTKYANNIPCTGQTGLRSNSLDVIENRGCPSGNDNFLAPLAMIDGHWYALQVVNFSSRNGFTITFNDEAIFDPIQDGFIVQYTGINAEGACISRQIEGSTHHIVVRPNPTEGQLWIDLVASINSAHAIQIIDSKGSLFKHIPIREDTPATLSVDLKDAPSGVYYLRVLDAKGVEFHAQSFVVI